MSTSPTYPVVQHPPHNPQSRAVLHFIEAGEKELELLDEPKRTIRAAQLHQEMLRLFQPQLTGDEMLGNYSVRERPLNDKQWVEP